jgi:Skp family chaperone for outer membrane proteins
MLKIIYIFLFIFLSFENVHADTNIKFIDIEFLIQNSVEGQKLIKELDKKKKDNSNLLKKKEVSLRSKEKELQKKKNIITKDEFNAEVSELRNDIDLFNKERNKINDEFNQDRLKKLSILIDDFNKVINNYIDNNSIDIVIDKKNLYMGKKSSDITSEILSKLNK